MLPPLSARISLAALRRNLRALRSILSPGSVFSVLVKSDGYGHGMGDVARVAAEEGSRFLLVASLQEALELSRLNLPGEILIVGPLFPEEAPEAVARGFSIALGNLEMARALDAAARQQGRQARVHLKFDTGMGRFGFLIAPSVLAPTLDALTELKGLCLEGAMTHFSEADDPASPFTQEQIERFRCALQELENRGIRPPWVHAANSAAVEYFRGVHFSMARIGVSAYGVFPGDTPVPDLTLEPVMTLVCRIADLREVPAGTTVSYGRTFVTQRPSRLALLPVGYGHGYPRHGSGRAEVMIRGRRVPTAGRVTMTLTIAAVTDLPEARAGDPVLMFGRLGEDLFRVEELARAAGTIPYEILCNVGRCAPRMVEEET